MDTIKRYTSALLLSLLTAAAYADPIIFEIESNYSAGGFQASYLHGSTGCRSAGPDSGETLYMCGNPLQSITGRIEGNLNGGQLQINGGSIQVGTASYDIYSGVINPFGTGDVSWFLMEHYGQFMFENISMGTGKPNYFDGNTMILWGQNMWAYNFDPGYFSDYRRGIDIVARKVTVPEPGTLSLLGLGLLGAALTRRRRPG